MQCTPVSHDPGLELQHVQHTRILDSSVACGAGDLRVTEDVAVRCCEAAKASASMGTVHQLMKVYRAACHYSDSEQETEMALQITSSRAFNKIMLFTLAEVS